MLQLEYCEFIYKIGLIDKNDAKKSVKVLLPYIWSICKL